MTVQDSGERSARLWGSYSLGELADAVWRVADLVGSAVEPVHVKVAPPGTLDEVPSVELVVREPVDVHHLRERLAKEDQHLAWVGSQPELWAAELNEVILTVRVERES